MIDLEKKLLNKYGEVDIIHEKTPAEDGLGFKINRVEMTLRYAINYCLLSKAHGVIPSENQEEARNYDFEIESTVKKFDLFTRVSDSPDTIEFTDDEVKLITNLAVQVYDTLKAGQIIKSIIK